MYIQVSDGNEVKSMKCYDVLDRKNDVNVAETRTLCGCHEDPEINPLNYCSKFCAEEKEIEGLAENLLVIAA